MSFFKHISDYVQMNKHRMLLKLFRDWIIERSDKKALSLLLNNHVRTTLNKFDDLHNRSIQILEKIVNEKEDKEQQLYKIHFRYIDKKQ